MPNVAEQIVTAESSLVRQLAERFGASAQPTADGVPTAWVDGVRIKEVLRHLKSEINQPYRTLYDLTVKSLGGWPVRWTRRRSSMAVRSYSVRYG